MPLLNGEIAYSSDQRNNSYIFVDLETDFDSADTLMKISDAAKLDIRCESAARRQMSRMRDWRPWFLKWHPSVSVMPRFIFYIIVKHPIHPEFPPRVTANSYIYDALIATSKYHVHIIQQALCTINNKCK